MASPIARGVSAPFQIASVNVAVTLSIATTTAAGATSLNLIDKIAPTLHQKVKISAPIVSARPVVVNTSELGTTLTTDDHQGLVLAATLNNLMRALSVGSIAIDTVVVAMRFAAPSSSTGIIIIATTAGAARRIAKRRL
mmetsp:Transcript_65455/g.122098  ORF Transcript_65455/g.122098 Transcript_65455/m.122098 type:complete len:139 (+) Transcript_65455:40-456(+)